MIVCTMWFLFGLKNDNPVVVLPWLIVAFMWIFFVVFFLPLLWSSNYSFWSNGSDGFETNPCHLGYVRWALFNNFIS